MQRPLSCTCSGWKRYAAMPSSPPSTRSKLKAQTGGRSTTSRAVIVHPYSWAQTDAGQEPLPRTSKCNLLRVPLRRGKRNRYIRLHATRLTADNSGTEFPLPDRSSERNRNARITCDLFDGHIAFFINQDTDNDSLNSSIDIFPQTRSNFGIHSNL